MIIQPQIQGVVARNCHPYGCQAAVKDHIKTVRALVQSNALAAKESTPKRVLILGASSGFGLASRIALMFGPAAASTIGVSFERGPSEKGVGSAGWYNNVFVKEEADASGLTTSNIIGDAFSEDVRQRVTDTIHRQFGGKVDMVVYSLATGVRPNPKTGEFWRSAIKPIGKTVSGYSIDLEKQSLSLMTLPPATEQDMDETIKVMGGEDWLHWMSFLSENALLAEGCSTVSYSYIGPEHTHDIYHDGTLGKAKIDLHQTRAAINTLLAPLNGHADVAVCKALVTKASVFIPGLTPYLLVLYKAMKAQGLHEQCIEQMVRLFYQKWPNTDDRDEDGLIRVDDWELSDEVQHAVNDILPLLNPDNFRELGDFDGLYQEFLQLNGFGFDDVDYQTEISLDALKALRP
ncbi:enoyl-ACP reductase FabV [Enterovibrio norvegicus]|uniref:Enoyl-[acyl-carrier-protein] reductase [NADH] n=1 Tax=Enterovibrio norvegicus DSM 15893 TaxID=1121869 RepID=A0A1I5M569_9GAMM|nr:enoyl-ACP reductase FabV [Enterovibrio norvegicus]SFP04754.1 enoyl-[acyl-carrier protein] reductase / trans-2-enoyl-CoA reductase (NAD+) [Enterovibrio norvegicus DSM 15893]